MRISADTPDRLTLEDRPWLIGSILIAAIVLLTGLALAVGQQQVWFGLALGLGACLFGAAFVAFVRRVIVIFDRPAGAVVIRTAGVLGQSEQTLALDDIERAYVETTTTRSTSQSRNRDTVTPTHRPVLRVSGSRVVPLTEVYTGGPGAEAAATVINRWLGAS